MSKYSDYMKQALTTYKDAKEKARSEIDFMRTNYGEEAGKVEIERQAAKMEKAREAAERTISAAYDEGRRATENWGRPDGSALTDDLRLFDAGVVTPEIFDTLKRRYADNATMSAALKARGEKLNAEAVAKARENGGVMNEPYNTRDIVTAETALRKIDDTHKKALDALDMIDEKGQYADDWGKSVAHAMIDEVLTHLGE